MVAKTFQSMTQLGDPYEVNGKSYVQVRNEKTGTVRQVRWYTPSEYRKLYPDAKENPSTSTSSAKTLLGFHKGFITIFRDVTEENEHWFSKSIARYHRLWGWYIVSNEEVPNPLPFGVTPVALPWELIGNASGELKDEEKINLAINDLLADSDHPSQFIGEVGQRIEVAVTVTRNISLENDYGSTNMHIMEDIDGNVYVWTTASKNWPTGSEKTIRGTIKSHSIYQGVKQTILTRCIEK